MTISVAEIPGRTAKWSLEKDFSRTYTRKFLSISTTVTDGAAVNTAVLSYMGASIGTSYSAVDPLAIMTDLDTQSSSRTEDMGKVWTSTATFKTWPGQDPSQSNSDPTSNPPVVSWGRKAVDVHVLKDKDNAAVVNPVGDPFESGLVVTKTIQTLQIEQNVLSINYATLRSLNNKMNNATWRGLPADTALCEGVDAKSEYRNGIFYYRITTHISIAPEDEDWNTNLLNCGYNKLVGGQVQKILDRFGQPVSSPRPLTSAGAVAAVGGPYSYTEFRVYDRINFTTAFGA